MTLGWFHAVSRLTGYFQAGGVLSVVAWLTVLAALAAFSIRLNRLFFHFVAVIVCALGALMGHILGGPFALVFWATVAGALTWLAGRIGRTALSLVTVAVGAVGIMLAAANSAAVSEIQVDRSQELQAARARLAQLESRSAGPQPSLLGDVNVPTSTAPAEDPAAAAPAYREAGRQSRTPQPTSGADDFAAFAAAGQHDAPAPRMMPLWDVIRANRFDHVNRFAAWLGLAAALLMLATDYLARLNQTFGSVLAAPICGRLLDALFPKTRTVRVEVGRGSTDPSPAVQAYLRTVVRKGETFIWFREAGAPVPASLPRMPMGLWPVNVMTMRPDESFGVPDASFIIESAWFARCCFVIDEAPLAERIWLELIRLIENRRRSGASARKTVHLIWSISAGAAAAAENLPPPGPSLGRLAELCRATNFKLVVFQARPDLGKRQASPGNPAGRQAAFEEEIPPPTSQ